MNKLLNLSKNSLLFILFVTIIIFLAIIFLNNKNNSPVSETSKQSRESNFDIINPSFTINNKQKISVKAERGNFISSQKILLENNVIFKSSNFKLKTNKAIYNKLDQTAKSIEVSKFQSDGTTIISEGFEITENGNIIFFNGKTKLNLNK